MGGIAKLSYRPRVSILRDFQTEVLPSAGDTVDLHNSHLVIVGQVTDPHAVRARPERANRVPALYVSRHALLDPFNYHDAADKRLARLAVGDVAPDCAGLRWLRRSCIQHGRAKQAENPERDDCRDSSYEDVLRAGLLTLVSLPSIVMPSLS